MPPQHVRPRLCPPFFHSCFLSSPSSRTDSPLTTAMWRWRSAPRVRWQPGWQRSPGQRGCSPLASAPMRWAQWGRGKGRECPGLDLRFGIFCSAPRLILRGETSKSNSGQDDDGQRKRDGVHAPHGGDGKGKRKRIWRCALSVVHH